MSFAPEFNAFGAARRKAVYEIVNRDQTDIADLSLMLALGSRESNLRNIAADGGHGRGYLQIDDRSHRSWLAGVKGCASGSWEPGYPSAADAGHVPTLADATAYAVRLLRDNVNFAITNGVPAADRLRFAVAAYNAGPTGALKGHRAGNVDLNTAGGDYSKDVLFTRRPQFAALIASADGNQPRHFRLTSPTRMKGDDVKRHQIALNARLKARSFPEIKADSEWGLLTDAANIRAKWLLGWPAGRLDGASPEDQRWTAAPETRPDGYKETATKRWDAVLEARRTRGLRVKATLDWALAQQGTVEDGGDNRGGKICVWQVDINRDCGWAWCGAFVGYALKHYGKNPIVGDRIVSVEKIHEDGVLRRNGMARTVQYEELKPGDLVLIDTSEEGPYNHVALYVGGGVTIEGNTGPSPDFPSNNGDGVYKKKRDPKTFSGFVRPTYGITLPSLGPVVFANTHTDDLDMFSSLVHDTSEADETALIGRLSEPDTTNE